METYEVICLESKVEVYADAIASSFFCAWRALRGCPQGPVPSQHGMHCEADQNRVVTGGVDCQAPELGIIKPHSPGDPVQC